MRGRVDTETCPACGYSKSARERFCPDCSSLVLAFKCRGEWWEVAKTGTEIPEAYLKHGQCEECGSWVMCPKEEAEYTDDDGLHWRTAALILVTPDRTPPYYRCECGAKYRIVWHIAGECLD